MLYGMTTDNIRSGAGEREVYLHPDDGHTLDCTALVSGAWRCSSECPEREPQCTCDALNRPCDVHDTDNDPRWNATPDADDASTGYVVEVKPSTGEATFTPIKFTGAFSSLRHDERTRLVDAYKRTTAEGYAVLFRCVAQIIAEREAEK